MKKHGYLVKRGRPWQSLRVQPDGIKDADEEHQNEEGVFEMETDITQSTLLHFATRLNAYRSLQHMLKLMEEKLDKERSGELINMSTHRCHEGCLLNGGDKNHPKNHPDHFGNDYDAAKGGTALMVCCVLFMFCAFLFRYSFIHSFIHSYT